ncbi:galactose mutarotase [Sphingomonas sp. LB-2]|uniref:aldose epimerase family protein n=1 Tax=Sphingomonas caeni TaxID=2984949 RepID=UPI00222EFEDD|nr:aldose epimerase family protein [Sphingomonas caeni]MCW3848357.1 galactose mutarotase [Sphingomonas caeni]
MRTALYFTTLAAALALPAAAHATDASRAPFGTLKDGTPVEAITLTNSHHMRVRVISYGATLQAVEVPDRKGRIADVALGYSSIGDYLDHPNYFGVSVGRFANRIRLGRFSIDGNSYQLATNNTVNALHGGVQGFDKRLWKVVEVASGPTAHVTLSYVSPDGEEGYPGTLTVTATYSLDETNNLTVEYKATTDKPTIVNLTNHALWNLAGEGSGKSVDSQVLTIPADSYNPVDAGWIPTGEFRSVAGTPFDFRKPMAIGARLRDSRDPQIAVGRGYDHNYVVARTVSPNQHLLSRLVDPASGRVLTITSNQPGVQVYTGNFLDGTVSGKGHTLYRQGDGIALEPQIFPDTPNRPEFGSARLDPGQTYRNVMTFSFSVAR